MHVWARRAWCVSVLLACVRTGRQEQEVAGSVVVQRHSAFSVTHSLSSDCLLLLLLAPRVGRVVVSRGESCEAHHDTTSIATGLTPFLLGIAPTSNTTSPCRGHVPGVPCQTRMTHSVKPVEMVRSLIHSLSLCPRPVCLSHTLLLLLLHYPPCSSRHAATHVCA